MVNTFISNFFIYSDENTLICFDTGFVPIIIRRELKKININPESVSGIFLTCPNISHIGGIKVFKNANIYLSKYNSSSKSKRLLSYLDGKSKMKHREIEDGEIVTIGKIKVKAFVIPDHPADSMSYMVNNSVIFI